MGKCNINTDFENKYFIMKNEFETYVVKKWVYSINEEKYKRYYKTAIVPSGFVVCAQDINNNVCRIKFDNDDKYVTSIKALGEFNKIIGDVLSCDEYYFCQDVIPVVDEKNKALIDKYYTTTDMIIGSSQLTREEIERTEKIDS